MFSMMSYSSSSVTVSSASPRESRDASAPIFVRTKETGVKRPIKKHSDSAVAKANRSLYFFAMLFGSISAMKNTTTVVTSVPAATAETPYRRVTSTVTYAATVRWRMFVPIRIVVIAFSKWSRTYSAFFARRLPRSARVLTRMRLTEANAVSASAKYTAPSKSSSNIRADDRLPSSIRIITLL